LTYNDDKSLNQVTSIIIISGGARGGQRGLSPLYEPLSSLLKIFEKYSFSMKYKIEHFLLFLFVN
jgi:hypothetical protein